MDKELRTVFQIHVNFLFWSRFGLINDAMTYDAIMVLLTVSVGYTTQSIFGNTGRIDPV